MNEFRLCPPNYQTKLFFCFALLFSLFVFESRAQQRQLTLEDQTPVTKLPATQKRWALVIGVDDYKDTQISGLRGAANDAKSLARALEVYAGFPADQIVLLATDQPEERQPTRVNILRRLSNLAALVPKDGLLLVSFAGHGMERDGQSFLLPADAQISNDVSFLEDTAVNVLRMKERIKKSGVGQVLILLDACCNDPGGRADEANNMSRNFANSFSFDVKNREVTAFATLYATAVGQRAYEYSEKKQGYFTWAVVGAMRGAAANEKGEVTLAALLKYVQENVPKRVAIDLGAGKNQKPFAVVEGYRAEDLIISVGASNTAKVDSPKPPENRERQENKTTQKKNEVSTNTGKPNDGLILVSKPGDLPFEKSTNDSSGAQLTAVLESSLSTKTARGGDRFTLRITSAGEYNGAIIEGRVAKVMHRGEKENVETGFGLVFDTVRLRDGRRQTFPGVIEVVYLNNTSFYDIYYEDEESVKKPAGDKGLVIGTTIGAAANKVSIITTDVGELAIKSGTEFGIAPFGSYQMMTNPNSSSVQPNAKDSSGLSGAWGVTLNMNGQPGFMILTLSREGERLNGTISNGMSQAESSAIQNGRILAGDRFQFAAKIVVNGQSMTAVFEGKISGTRLSGTIASAQGSMTFSAVKAGQ